MRRLLVVCAVLGVVGAACTTWYDTSEGLGKPPCTARTALPSTPAPPRPTPTIVNDPPTDLRVETPGYGYSGVVSKGQTPSHRDPVAFSADGSKSLLVTDSQNAVPVGFPGSTALILRDLTTGQNTVVRTNWGDSPYSTGDTAAFLPDGSVAFTEAGTTQPYPPNYTGVRNVSQVFRWDVNTHALTNLSLGPDGNPITSSLNVFPREGAGNIDFSADGRYLFFTSRTALGADDAPEPSTTSPSGDVVDLFRRDTVTGQVVKIDVGNHPELGPVANGSNRDISNYSVSADGNLVAFAAPATGGLAEWGFCGSSDVSLLGDLVFLRDISAGTTTLVSHDPTGVQRYGTLPHISADGRTVLYQNLYGSSVGYEFSHLAGVQTVMWDRLTDTTDWVLPTATGSAAVDYIDPVAASPDNDLVLFTTMDEGSRAQGIVPGDGDLQKEIVLYDRAANSIRKVSLLADGTNIWTNNGSTTTGLGAWGLWLSPDGSRAYFPSYETLLPSDTNPGPHNDLYSVALN
jgi:hypothetical protein